MSDYVRALRGRVGHDVLLQVPSVSVAVRHDDGRVLLARHAEGDAWLLPGGAVEPGEAPADAAVREAWEETGLLVRLAGIVGVFGGPDFVVEYAKGDRTSYVMTVFEARAGSGRPRADGSELLEVRFVAAGEWEGLRCAPLAAGRAEGGVRRRPLSGLRAADLETGAGAPLTKRTIVLNFAAWPARSARACRRSGPARGT